MISATEAHPHVWIDTVITAMFDRGTLTALREDWSFDEDFTAMALSEVRKGNDKSALRPLTEGEVQQLKLRAFANLAQTGYLTHVWAKDKSVAVSGAVTAFSARLDGGKLTYSFTLPLAAPLDPRVGVVRIGVWDDTYFIDVGPAKGVAARVEGEGSSGCRAGVVDDQDHPIYFGAVIPKVIEISC